MRYHSTQARKACLPAIASTGLIFAWLLGPSQCGAGTLRSGSRGDDPTKYRQTRTCNPPPEATKEDMSLAMAVLRDTTQIEHWDGVAWYLGELGFPESFEPLRDFVWAIHDHGDSLPQTLAALTKAQASIGHVAASNPAALDYLIQSTNPSFWESLPWKDHRRTAREVRLEMSKASITGLGWAGVPEAGQMLSRLRQWPYVEAQRTTIDEAFRRFRYVSLGRKYSPADLRSVSRLHLPEILRESTDSSLIFGAWRWMRSSGWGWGYYAPPVCGWSRTLVLERDSSYSLWEEDSVDTYRICGGKFTMRTAPKGSWIEFEDWSWGHPNIYWPRIMGPNLIALRPGEARGVWHGHLGLTHYFTRVPASGGSFDRISAKSWRPPRVRRLSSTAYSIEVPEPLRRLSGSAESRRWSSYSRLGPEEYEYTHYQTPSGVIGDFDGDSLADVAILGYDDDDRNVVTCLLSNRGAPQAAVAWTEHGSGSEDGPTRPRHYLKLFASGRSYVNSRGQRTVLSTDAIWVVGKDGGSSILYHGNGGFHQAKPAHHGGD